MIKIDCILVCDNCGTEAKGEWRVTGSGSVSSAFGLPSRIGDIVGPVLEDGKGTPWVFNGSFGDKLACSTRCDQELEQKKEQERAARDSEGFRSAPCRTCHTRGYAASTPPIAS